MPGPQKIGDLIQHILPEHSQDIQQILGVTRRWRDLVGDRLAGYSKVVEINDGILVVDLAHPGFKQLFQMEQKKILYKLNKENPELKVKRIRLRIVDNLEQSPPSYSLEKKPEPKIQTVKKRRDGQSPGDAFLEAMKEEKPE
jgi:hypothetical protein